MWSRAGNVMVTARLRLNTYRVAVARLTQPALGSAWWPLRLRDELGELHEKALVLWLNSTLGLISLLAIRVDTEGAWTQFKKPSLQEMVVLDPRELNEDQLQALADAYDEVDDRELGRFPAMAGDPVRDYIDGALAAALGLPALDTLRALLAQEPVVSTNALV